MVRLKARMEIKIRLILMMRVRMRMTVRTLVKKTDEIEDVDDAESKGLNCRCANRFVDLIMRFSFE